MMKWIIRASEDPEQMGPVNADAAILTHRLLAQVLMPSVTIENGEIIVPSSATHKMAHEIWAFAQRGGVLEDGT